MERGRIVQDDQLAGSRQSNTFAMPRDLLEDREGAAERLYAGPLPIFGIVVDIALWRLHQLGNGGPAHALPLITGLLFCPGSHRVKPPRSGYRTVSGHQEN